MQSIASGNWSSPSTWDLGRVPQEGDPVLINAGHSVVYDFLMPHTPDVADGLAQLDIYGQLYLSRSQPSQLVMSGNLFVQQGGHLDMGTPTDFIPAAIFHTLVFAITQAQAAAYLGSPIKDTSYIGDIHAMNPEDIGLYCLHLGRWDAHGSPHLRPWVKLLETAPSGATVLIVEGDCRDWYVNGDVLVTQTSNMTPVNIEQIVRENEVRQIMAVAPLPDLVRQTLPGFSETIARTQLTLSQPLSYSHEGNLDPAEPRGEAGLLTRNIRISTDIAGVSEAALEPVVTLRPVGGVLPGTGSGRYFAHTMYMHTGLGDCQYVELKYMGHAERLGLYPLHVHLSAETSTGKILRGNSVWYSGNRGIVLHETHEVLVEDNVVFNTVGGNYFIEMTPAPEGALIGGRRAWGGLITAPYRNRIQHNLGVECMLGGLSTLDNSIFWFDEFYYQLVLGNCAVGSNINGWSTRNAGYSLEETPQKFLPGKVVEMHYVKNEAHSCHSQGLLTWQGNIESHDLLAWQLWRNSQTGHNWNSYVATFRAFRGRYIENGQYGILTQSVRVHIQDSYFRSGGNDARKRLNMPAAGLFISNYTVGPRPETGSHFFSNRFERDGYAGYVGDIGRNHVPCTVPGGEQQIERDPVTFQFPCPPDYFEIAGNIYTDKPFDAGWHENANSYLRVVDFSGDPNLPAAFYLHRPDQTVGSPTLGVISSQIVRADSFYYAKADAVVTPIDPGWPSPSIPSYPPQAGIQVTRNGFMASVVVTASDDLTPAAQLRIELFLNGAVVAAGPGPTLSFDLDLRANGLKYNYLYARVVDPTETDAAGTLPDPALFTRDQGVAPEYLQGTPWQSPRAYSEVVEIGPEALLVEPPPPPPPGAPVVEVTPQAPVTVPPGGSFTVDYPYIITSDQPVLSQEWSVMSAPPGATLSIVDDPVNGIVSVTYFYGGQYTLRLSVTNASGTGFADLVQTVAGEAPPPLSQSGSMTGLLVGGVAVVITLGAILFSRKRP